MIMNAFPPSQGADQDIPLIKDVDISRIVEKVIASNHGIPKKWMMSSAEQVAAIHNGTFNTPENNQIIAPPRRSGDRMLPGGLPTPRPPIRPSVPPVNVQQTNTSLAQPQSQSQLPSQYSQSPYSSVVYYEDGNTIFKEENGILYRKGWCDCRDMGNYRMLNKNGVELSLKGKTLQVYDWIPMKKRVSDAGTIKYPETINDYTPEHTEFTTVSNNTSKQKIEPVIRTEPSSNPPSSVEHAATIPLAPSSAPVAGDNGEKSPLSGSAGK